LSRPKPTRVAEPIEEEEDIFTFRTLIVNDRYLIFRKYIAELLGAMVFLDFCINLSVKLPAPEFRISSTWRGKFLQRLSVHLPFSTTSHSTTQ